ncbi:MAG TPA: metallophosphoesterase [Acidimicrobiia bacterium]|nr:metallophosphoesterase [Acidimicrobiia bacterium]
MIFVSDVHDSPEALRRLVTLDEEIVILGDLVNLTDYRTGVGAVAAVMGDDFATLTSMARAAGDYAGMRELWTERAGDTPEEVRTRIVDQLSSQYRAAGEALSAGRGLVIHGNVDRPQPLQMNLPNGFTYVHGQVVERDGLRMGFVGGGVPTPMRAEGELSDDEMKDLLETIGPVDVLCTHVPPAIGPLRRDVITGRDERGSGPVLAYLTEHQPRFHLFGDVHQPQASTWRVGRTRCVNAGYFRATGRFLRLRDGVVHVDAIG